MSNPLVERLLLGLGVAIIYALYFPLSHYTGTLAPFDLSLPIDHAAQLVPGWIYVYFMVFFAAWLPIFVVRDRFLFRRVAACYAFVTAICLVVFVLVPVHMTLRPTGVAIDSFATWGIRLCYFIDQPTNCFPSMHVALSVLAGLCAWKADRVMGVFGVLIGLSIAVSTMLVKQHFFADAAAGLGMAVLGYALFVHRAPRSVPYSRWMSGTVVVLVYVGAVAACYGLYRAGFAPWDG